MARLGGAGRAALNGITRTMDGVYTAGLLDGAAPAGHADSELGADEPMSAVECEPTRAGARVAIP